MLARDRAVHAVIVGRDAADRRKRGLAAGPEARTLAVIVGGSHFDGTRIQQALADLRNILRDLLVAAIDLAQQDSRGIGRVAGVHEVFGGAQGGVVHHLQTGRDDAGGDDVGHRLAGRFDVVECGQRDLRTLRHRQQLDGHLDDYAEHALGAGHQGQQVVAGAVQRRCRPA